MNSEISIIKNLFLTEFPYQGIDFKIEFFSYLESLEDEKTLDILIKLLRVFQLVKNEEKQNIIRSIKDTLKEQGINLKISD